MLEAAGLVRRDSANILWRGAGLSSRLSRSINWVTFRRAKEVLGVVGSGEVDDCP